MNVTHDNDVIRLLSELDGNLANEESVLLQQIEEIQSKRASLRDVLTHFREDVPIAKPVEEAPKAPRATKAKVAPAPIAAPEEEEPEPEPVPTRKTRGTKKTPGKRTIKSGSKRAENAEHWQSYLAPEYSSEKTLSSLVGRVLLNHPNRDFSTAEVLSFAFKELPEGELKKRLKARVSTILVTGTGSRWDRVAEGRYTVKRAS